MGEPILKCCLVNFFLSAQKLMARVHRVDTTRTQQVGVLRHTNPCAYSGKQFLFQQKLLKKFSLECKPDTGIY